MARGLLLLVIVGAAVYFLVRALQSRDAAGSLPWSKGNHPAGRKRPTRPAPPPRMVAPDDDEEFLRDLDRRRMNPEDPERPE